MCKAILVGDESEDDAIAIRDVLEKASAKNPAVNDSHQEVAGQRVAESHGTGEQSSLPGVLLLDLKRPGANSFQMSEWVRAASEFTALFVVVHNGYRELKEVQQLCRLGAHSFQIKPCDPELTRNLRQWFLERWERRRRRRAARKCAS
jgi:CheY-like chemotaxis protein